MSGACRRVGLLANLTLIDIATNESVFTMAAYSVFHDAGTEADCGFIVEDTFHCRLEFLRPDELKLNK